MSSEGSNGNDEKDGKELSVSDKKTRPASIKRKPTYKRPNTSLRGSTRDGQDIAWPIHCVGFRSTSGPLLCNLILLPFQVWDIRSTFRPMAVS